MKRNHDEETSESSHCKKRRTDESSDDEFAGIDKKMDKAIAVLREQEKKNGEKITQVDRGFGTVL